MNVKLLQCSSLEVLIKAIRTCYDSNDRSDSKKYHDPILHEERFILGEKDSALIKRIIESKHDSTLEHIIFSFDISGISRLVLQELARHRMASYSVKSTRYTLKELKNETRFFTNDDETKRHWKRAEKYINFTGEDQIDLASVFALEYLRQLIAAGYTNDMVKYSLPECYKTDLVWTINLRSLRNFLQLRLAKEAHFEIRELACTIKNILPNEYQFLIENINNCT